MASLLTRGRAIIGILVGGTFAGNTRFHNSLASKFGFGTPEAVTIASGVATLTRPFAELTSESSTSDQLDNVTLSGVQAGDIVVLTAAATHTITVDDGSIDLGAATRTLVPGNFLTLIYNGTTWSELAYAAGDNVT